MPPTPSLYPQFPHTNSLTKLTFLPETLPTSFSSIRTLSFKIKPSEYPETKHLISYIPWTELWATVKDFPKLTEDPHRFSEELNVVIQMYHLGFSDLHQLIHMHIGEDQAQHWMEITNWEKPDKFSRITTGQPNTLLYDQDPGITRWLHQAIPRAFPQPVDWNKI